MVKIPIITFIFIYIALICALTGSIYIVIVSLRASLDKENRKKFRVICKMECRHPFDQEKYIVKEYIKRYSEEKQINWDEYI